MDLYKGKEEALVVKEGICDRELNSSSSCLVCGIRFLMNLKIADPEEFGKKVIIRSFTNAVQE